MKKCAYCGEQKPDDAVECHVCHTPEFNATASLSTAAAASESLKHPTTLPDAKRKRLDLNSIIGIYAGVGFVIGFSGGFFVPLGPFVGAIVGLFGGFAIAVRLNSKEFFRDPVEDLGDVSEAGGVDTTKHEQIQSTAEATSKPTQGGDITTAELLQKYSNLLTRSGGGGAGAAVAPVDSKVDPPTVQPAAQMPSSSGSRATEDPCGELKAKAIHVSEPERVICSCDHCSQRLRFSAERVETEITCPNCGRTTILRKSDHSEVGTIERSEPSKPISIASGPDTLKSVSNDKPESPAVAEWHYVVGSDRQGAISEHDLIVKIKSGELGKKTKIWKEGLPKWILLGNTRFIEFLSKGEPPPLHEVDEAYKLGRSAPINATIDRTEQSSADKSLNPWRKNQG